ncbi:OprD family outer membrane porin [Flavihumibacter rivuli]|uniref:OprD family outer membrane porin n=1 Tax=Flavihumibacter rivuli TaxID=2838156 RepID=UPI001BDE9A6A|nr:OprD family outer membrane porin [Flavihumibacter rivuli]ULQ58222.1 OprD family outer membrane porin [Flavihumibacter rivuli]
MKKLLTIVIGILLFNINGFAQDHKEDSSAHNGTDTNSLAHAFRKGSFHGHFRYFYMSTDNAPGLSDYYSNAIGGGIKFETAPFHGFQVGIGGFIIYNIGSSDLGARDPKTNASNRYEIGLFDIENPYNKDDIDRLEELYLKYSYRKSSIVVGKQLPDLPFINKQDGRMRPTEINGAIASINEIKRTQLTLGYIWGFSPRSTVQWYGVGESIGLYPQGLTKEGKPAAYHDSLSSKGVIIAGIKYNMGKSINLEGWNQYVDNIFNTTLIQVNLHLPVGHDGKLMAGLQYVHQVAVKDGGNAIPEHTYFEKGGRSNAFGVMAGYKTKKIEASLNYTRITKDGRYLMPREWGKEPFFTFLPRERNEGFGDVNAIVAKFNYTFPRQGISLNAGYGHFYLPEVTNYALNKYGMPSYNQLNLSARYPFHGFLQGLDMQVLYVYKGNLGDLPGNDKYLINKVNMSQWNIIVNYHF